MPIRKPRAIRPGSTIGVLAPASAPRRPEDLTRGIAHLERLGYHVIAGRPAYPPFGYLSGQDEARLHELNTMFRRDDVDAILCVRGGFGSLRLLPQVDFDALREHPKLLVGYSDITALQLALYTKTGIPSLAGAMVASDFSEPDLPSLDRFWPVLAGDAPFELTSVDGSGLIPMRTGIAEGILLGGNLTLIARLIGTPYFPAVDGAILFLEEIGEEPYRIDGLLAQLKLSGVLDRVGGVVVGAITEWEPTHERPTLSVDDVLEHYLSPLACPVARGLQFGHIRRKISVPIGVRARLEVGADAAGLTVLESPVES